MIITTTDEDVYIDTDELIGRKIDEAVRLLSEAANIEYRIMDEDKQESYTADHKFFRMNLKVKDGLVYDIKWG